MFKFLYELFGKNVDPTYATDVYPFVGLFTLLIVLVFVALFYVALGRWKPVWYKLGHWFVTLIILLLFAFFFAFTKSKEATGEDTHTSFMWKLAFVNVLYTFIYFIVFSLLFKKISIFAKHTPF